MDPQYGGYGIEGGWRMNSEPALPRVMGGFDATTLGIGSMIGAGVFVVFAPAAASAGSWLPLAVALAGFIAYCNAAASAALASVYPHSGGSYVYGRRQLGPWAGFMAGWSFVTGKLASCAAMALTFGSYAAPGYAKPAAVAAVLALTGVNLMGVTRTALATRIVVSLVVPVLAFVLVVAFAGPAAPADAAGAQAGAAEIQPWGVMQAGALLFFAFAGFARIATMGGEVRRPERNIPAAIMGALGFTVALYMLLAVALLWSLGPTALAASPAPLRDVVVAGSSTLEGLSAGGSRAGGSTADGAAIPLAALTIAAILASLGALLALIAGVSRTMLAMASEGDLPRPLVALWSRTGVPWVAEVSTGVVVIVLLLTTDVLTVVGFSSFGVLLYYAVANAAAFTLPVHPWYAPRALNAIGAVGCVVLAATLPVISVATMLGILAVGVLARAILRRRGRSATPSG